MSKSIGRVIDQGVRQYQRQTFTQETQWESEPYREKKEEPDKTGYPGSDFVKPVFTEKKEKYPNLYASLGGKETKNYFLMVLGDIMAGFMGVAFMAVLLIQALDDVMHIQKEGRARRQEADYVSGTYIGCTDWGQKDRRRQSYPDPVHDKYENR